MYDVIIIGGGPAGLTAAIYSARGGLSTLVLAGAAVGGQALQTSLIENYSGIPSADGYALMEAMRKQAIDAGAEIKREKVIALDLAIKSVTVEGGKIYEGKALIIATGAKHRRLGLQNEEELIGQGISYCATCDGGFFRKKAVAVVGGGDTALTEALYLSRLCSEVYLIHRRDEYRASQILVDRVSATENIIQIRGGIVEALIGTPLSAIEVDVKGEKKVIPLRGLFIAVGSDPDVELVRDALELFGGYIAVDEKMQTSVDGVFAAGDVRHGPLKQIITACADGAVAATSAANYIRNI